MGNISAHCDNGACLEWEVEEGSPQDMKHQQMVPGFASADSVSLFGHVSVPIVPRTTEAERLLPWQVGEYVVEARQRLAACEPAFPCGLESCGRIHSWVDGPISGFCSDAHRQLWLTQCEKQSLQLTADAATSAESWEDLEPCFGPSLRWRAGDIPYFDDMGRRVEEVMMKQTVVYTEVLADVSRRASDSERKALACLERSSANLPGFESPASVQCLQPLEAESFAGVYAMGLVRLGQLYQLSISLAKACQSPHPAVLSVKRPPRLREAGIIEHPVEYWKGSFSWCSDVYRSSVVVDSPSQVLKSFELLKGLMRTETDIAGALSCLDLGHDSEIIVERLKNRFAEPCVGGYRDLLANVRIDGYVMEVQIHLARLLDERRDHGRRIYRWARRFVGRVDKFEGERSAVGQRHGIGEQVYATGDRFSGCWENDLMHGRGVLMLSSGERYEGDWLTGLKHGKGELVDSQGCVYMGEWQRDKRQGVGQQKSAAGDMYEGEWLDDLQHGDGVIKYAFGDRYSGQFLLGRKHGSGAFVFAGGSERYVGEFCDDSYHGKGAVTCADGEEYDGEWCHGKRHGRGTSSYPCGDRFEGQWADDARHGSGLHVQDDKTVDLSRWESGKAVGIGFRRLFSNSAPVNLRLQDGELIGEEMSEAEAELIAAELGFERMPELQPKEEWSPVVGAGGSKGQRRQRGLFSPRGGRRS